MSDESKCACAHLNVRYVPTEVMGGRMHSRWICKDCAYEFIPKPSGVQPSDAREWDKFLNVPVRIGLRQQGHMDTVTAMVLDGKSWAEIGKAIGWEG